MHTLLKEREISEGLRDLNKWTHEGDALAARFEFVGFDEAMAFVQAVADVARSLDHHPELRTTYNWVELRLTTHDVGGITTRDLAFARCVSEHLGRG